MRNYKEQTLQEWCADFLNRLPILYCASAGGVRTSIGTAVKMKRAGYKKGFPDIFIYEPRLGYKGLAIELKSGSRPTVEQKEWQRELIMKGYAALIMPSNMELQEAITWFKDAVSNYLNGGVVK